MAQTIQTKKISDLFFPKRFYLFISILLLFSFWIPYFILCEHGSYLIHDNFDSTFVWPKVLMDHKLLFADNSEIVASFMNGLPRSSFPSELNIPYLWHIFFGHIKGYIFDHLVVSIFAFCGMLKLLSYYGSSKENDTFINYGVAVCFASLPFWPAGGLSVAGLPLITYIFLKLRENKAAPWHWPAIVIYTFYSSLFLTGIFFILILCFILLLDMRRSKARITFFTGLALLALSYIMSHYRMFFQFFFERSYISSRSEYIFPKISLGEAFQRSWDMTLYAHYHAPSLHKNILMPLVFIVLIWQISKKELDKRLLGIVLTIFLSYAFFAFYPLEMLSPLTSAIAKIIPMQMDRFYWLAPPLWYLAFALALQYLYRQIRPKLLLVLPLLAQIIVLGANQELLTNRESPSYQAFFATKQFQLIKSYIGQPQSSYRVVSFGMHPSIAQFNGFYTLDGYSAYYPLSYKHEFRKIIAPVLNRNPSAKQYFDGWGARAYIFSQPDLGFMNTKNLESKLEKLDLDVQALKSMGGRFIISAIELNPSLNPHFKLREVFEHNESAWRIFLYEVL